MAATTQEVLTHHLDTFGKGDLAGVMADYSPESRLFTPNGMLKGPEAIRQLFTTQFKEFAKPGASFQMLRQDVDGDTAYILWKAETADNRYGDGDRHLRGEGWEDRYPDLRGEGHTEALRRSRRR